MATTDEGETDDADRPDVPLQRADYLVHVFGRGLEGDRYVTEKYRSRADGQIHRVEAEQSWTKARRGKRRTIMSAGAVKKLRPERDEIIVCPALNLKASGIQL